MKSFAAVTCLLVPFIAAVGCQKTPPASPPAPDVSSTPETVHHEPEENLPDQEEEAAKPEAVTPPENEHADSHPVSNPEAGAETPTPPKESQQRVVLLTLGGPLVVDFLVTVDGLAPAAALERLIDDELLAADENRDGRPKWREVANSPRFRYGPITSNPAEVIRLYDADRDGIVGRHELLRFLTNNVGPWDSFTLRSSHQARERSDSPLLELLDVDRDGKLSQIELTRAAAQLMNLDQDDDEVVTLAELEPDSSPSSKPMSLRRRTDAPEVAWWIQRRTKWDYVAYSLAESYAASESLTADDLPLTPNVAIALDANEDGKVVGDEFQGLAEIEPHVVVKVVFAGWEQVDSGTATHLKLQSLADSLESAGVTVQESLQRIVLAWQGAQIQFFVNEDPMLRTSTVDAADLDEDGTLSEYETTQYMSRKLAVYRGLIRARAVDREDRWFAALDVDGDGRLGSREIEGAHDRLMSLDGNNDGLVQSHEIPRAMVIGFVRGNPSQDDNLYALAPATRHVDPATPAWFSGMDSNEDGEISRREFLGTSDQFTDLDENEDGFIGPQEASSRT